jgi:hypothetical protein
MPAQKTKSGLYAKYGPGLKKAWNEHRGDETEYSKFGELPAGIEGGIARLVECKFDQFKKGEMQGEFYFYAAGILLSPKEHEGMHVQGLRTQIMEPVCATPGRSRQTQAEHLAWIANEMRKLGLSTVEIEAEDLEEMAKALKESAPVFRFRTWKGQATEEYPDPRVNHSWEGACQWTPEIGEEIVDRTASSNGVGSAKTTASFNEFEDLESLVQRASNRDEEAQDTLKNLALSTGAPEEEVENAPNWEEVAEMIRRGSKSEKPSPATASEPEKDQVVGYRPLDVKTKKPAKKAVQCEITKVNHEQKTVTLLNLDNGKTEYPGIPWSSLEDL